MLSPEHHSGYVSVFAARGRPKTWPIHSKSGEAINLTPFIQVSSEGARGGKDTHTHTGKSADCFYSNVGTTPNGQFSIFMAALFFFYKKACFIFPSLFVNMPLDDDDDRMQMLASEDDHLTR